MLPTLYYFPDFIAEDEEQRIMAEVHASQAKWVQLSGRRLQNHGGIVHSKGLIPAPMPRWLQQLCSRVHSQLLPLFGEQPPNHVLINAYQPGCGIMPHQDGPLYHPVVLILSLGSPAVLRFWRKQDEGGTGNAPPVASLLATPRSLLVFCDEAYHSCLHGIEEVTEEVLDASVVNLEALEQQQQQSQQQQQQQEQQQEQELQAERQEAGQQRQAPQQQAQQQQSEQQQQKQQSGHVNAAEVGSQPAAAGNATAAAQRAGGSSNGSHRCDSGTVPCSVPRQGERISLTIRRVLKVHKALGLLRR